MSFRIYIPFMFPVFIHIRWLSMQGYGIRLVGIPCDNIYREGQEHHNNDDR